jgi:xylan 1,4-beta-xylosidase
MNGLRQWLFVFCLGLAPAGASAQAFNNPVLAGFYPDPSICKGSDGYYMVTSSFAYFPGLPIFYSKDLLNWTSLGGVLNRPEQLNLEGAGVSRGLFAPAITFHNGKYYVVCTLVDKGGNFIVTTDDPKKGVWSNPVWLPEVNGIDPSLFFDDDGKAYVVYNSIPPDNISQHNGHRTIRINSLDAATLKVTSPNRIIVNGGTDMAKKPVWIEAPHIIKKDGWYYLICAEGGTAYNHSEVVFRTRSLTEPFVPYEANPILTQRHLDRNRPNPVTVTGHADFTVGPDGQWWAVFLGCRPYEGEHFNTGRETFMAPVNWRDGWPHIDLGGDVVRYRYPINATVDRNAEQYSGNFLFKDEFNSKTLNHRFVFLRTPPATPWYRFQQSHLQMDLQPITCSDKGNPSFIGFRQSHLSGHAATELQFNAGKENEKAGLLLFQNEHHYYFFAKSVSEGKPVLQLYKGAGNSAADKTPIRLHQVSLPTSASRVQLKAVADGNLYSFYYALPGKKWMLFLDKVDAKFLSTQTAQGFVGSLYALYASSHGQPSAAKAAFAWFEARNNDAVYR